ncbi:MAG: metalloregulator ArsR/SmtB family transcription factor [Patescibacteria group bacterium]|nr:metalloregulator ArsR/SmtB family transcription factor [Patescibacteria group bacterium]
MEFSCCKNNQSKKELAQSAEFLKIIAEENRLKIICLLKHHDRCVCDIWQYLDLPQNLISHHLKILKDFELVSSKKQGTKVIYSLNSKKLKKYYLLLSHYINN